MIFVVSVFAPAVDEMLSQQQHRRDYVGSTDLPATLPPNAAELYSENPAAFAQALYLYLFEFQKIVMIHRLFCV